MCNKLQTPKNILSFAGVTKSLKATFKYFLLVFIIGLLYTSCKKERFTTSSGDKLEVRQDTLWFDTVFTNVNNTSPKSVNKQIVIVNPHKDKIKTSINLAGGLQSHFRMNVDGVPGHEFTDLEIFPEDSLFVFIEVHPDPNNNSPDFNPLIIRDSVMFYTNGNEQKVNLIGWGQDAHYIFRDSIEQDTTWANSQLPIVVYGYFYVKPNVKLNIEKGMNIHFAPSSWLFVEGELEINGTYDEPVIMQGDRLQPDWEETPGQWGGVWISHPSKGSYINHALIKNGTVGVYCDSTSGDNNLTPNITIDQCHIRNMLFDGIAGRYSNIQVRNTVSENCGRFTFLGSFGGEYDIRHCTFHTGTKDFNRQEPTFGFTNINRDDFGSIISEHPIDFYMVNSIVWGSNVDGEIGADLNSSANWEIENCLLRSNSSIFDNNNNILGEDPLFKNSTYFNFELDSTSAAKDKGIDLSPPINIDFRGVNRTAPPDIGAFESDY